MGIFSNKEKLTPEQQAEKLFKPFIFDTEIIITSHASGVTFFALTDKRLIALDKISEYPKSLITTIPLSKINAVEIEKGSGLFGFKKEITVQASSKKIKIELYDEQSAIDLYNKINKLIIQ